MTINLISSFDVIRDTIPSMPDVLTKIIVEMAGSQYAKIETTTGEVAKNIFFGFFSVGIRPYLINKDYINALKYNDLQTATKLLQEGAFVSKPVKLFFKLIRAEKNDAAGFLLAQEQYSNEEFFQEIYRLKTGNIYYTALRIFLGFSAYSDEYPNAHIGRYTETNKHHYGSQFFLRAVRELDYVAGGILLSQGVNVSEIRCGIGMHKAFLYISQNRNATPLESQVKYIRFWVEHGLSVNTVERDDRMQSLLWASVVRNDAPSVEYLLQNGAKTEIAARYVEHPGTPIRAAVSKEFVNIVRLLLEFNANPYRNMCNTGQMHASDNTSALQLAQEKRNPAILQELQHFVNQMFKRRHQEILRQEKLRLSEQTELRKERLKQWQKRRRPQANQVRVDVTSLRL